MKRGRWYFIKLLITITLIVIFSVLFFIWLYYYNNFHKDDYNSSNLKTIGSIKDWEQTNNIKTEINNINKEGQLDIIKNLPDEKEQLNTKEGEKKNNEENNNNVQSKSKIEEKNNVKHSKIKEKISNLILDKRKLYFWLKFINYAFFFYKDGPNIIIIKVSNKEGNFFIRNNYKEKINNIITKKDIIDQEIINKLNNLLEKEQQNVDSSNNISTIKKENLNIKKHVEGSDLSNQETSKTLNPFLSWFLSSKSWFWIYWSDIVNTIDLKTWYNYPLYGRIYISFDVNKILFFNNLYDPNVSLFDNLIKNLWNKEDNVLFVNWTNKEVKYFLTYFLERIKKNKEENIYSVYKITVNNIVDFNVFLLLKRLTYYINNKYNKNINLDVRKLIADLSKNEVLKNLFRAYYKQIKKYTMINSFKVESIYYINWKMEKLPVVEKKEIELIMDNLSNKLIIDWIREKDYIKKNNK